MKYVIMQQKSRKISCLLVLSSAVGTTLVPYYRGNIPPGEAQKSRQDCAGLGSGATFFLVPSRQKCLEGALLLLLSIENDVWLWRILINFLSPLINEELEGSQASSSTAAEDLEGKNALT